ncbi:hypothetical protein NMY3_02553 [Candidatus Nitrosocosmicus oleophilus]|uniref:Uncharacterized protein n=1 Tax=Candidatus Nitrosocosmicus oleophilus TaxID=1353260 RepID=A0A654LYY0_9ARCH|nr:hypothetical protein NMY3_02553 [Candidatus Nitrosocosmicus oleophilus]
MLKLVKTLVQSDYSISKFFAKVEIKTNTRIIFCAPRAAILVNKYLGDENFVSLELTCISKQVNLAIHYRLYLRIIQ